MRLRATVTHLVKSEAIKKNFTIGSTTPLNRCHPIATKTIHRVVEQTWGKGEKMS